MKNRNIIAVLSALVGLALLPIAQAAPAPEFPDPTSTCAFCTADGFNALANATGAGNSAFGWYSLWVDTTGSFNTAVGAGALDLNNGSNNTAVGTAALLLNGTASNDTAVGAAALENDQTGFNTGVGVFALLSTVTSLENVAVGFGASQNLVGGPGGLNGFSVAVGFQALQNATDGQNTAVGDNALQALTTGTLNTAIGDLAGIGYSGGESSNICIGGFVTGTAGENNHVRIGDNLPEFPAESSQCFIGGINSHVQVANMTTVCQVTVDAFSHIGVDCSQNDGQNVGVPQLPGQAQSNPANPQNRKAQGMLNRKVEELETTVAQLKAQLKEQAAQIQKVSAQLEVNKPASKVVVNKP